jgi:Zn-dependent protease with chaperone function
MWTGLLVAALAGVPGGLAWWWGRRLSPDDPALPERLDHYRRRLAEAGLASGLVCALLGPGRLWWVVPLMVGGLLVGGFPARRRVYEERWGLVAYLSHVARATAALGGFALLLALAPVIVHAAGPARWPTAVLLAILLLAWSTNGPAVFRWLVRATPLRQPDLEGRFAAVLAGARLTPPPRLYRAGLRDGRWANAFALPSSGQGAIVLTETLLERFDAGELAAVLGHEVAHLEHYRGRRLWWTAAGEWAAVGLGTLGVPLATAWLDDRLAAGAWGHWAWLLAVALGLGVRQARHKRHESESDRRAAELCGDPEALVRALVKLTLLARLPRRWDAATERMASHPSLARRIQAIRGAPPPAAAGSPTVLPSTAPGRFVVLDAERVHRLEGVPPGIAPEPAGLLEHAAQRQAVAYGELVELRVRARLRGPAALVARDRVGRSWTLPLAPEAVGPAQAALDAVETRLAGQPPGVLRHPLLAMGLAALALPLAYLGWHPWALWTLALLFIVATVRATPATLAALGAVAVAGAILAVPEGFVSLAAPAWQLAALGALAALGVGALGIAAARVRAGEVHDRAGLALTAAALLLGAWGVWLPMLVSVAYEGGTVLALHQAARHAPSAVLAPLGMAAALATWRGRPARWAMAAVLALAAAIVAVGTDRFAERFAADPLLEAGPALAWRDGTARVLREAHVTAEAIGLRLAPSGWVYAVHELPDEDDRPARFHLGRFGNGARIVEARDLQFLADGRALALTGAGPDTELRVIAPDGAAADPWRQALPGLVARDLLLDPVSGAWRVAGYDARARALVLASGIVGGAVTTERLAKAPGPDDPEDPVYVETLLCLADDRAARTLAWSLDPESGARQPLGALPAGIARSAPGPDGRAALLVGSGGVLFDPAARTAVRFALAGKAGRVAGLAFEPGRLGVVRRHPGGATVTVYEVR